MEALPLQSFGRETSKKVLSPEALCWFLNVSSLCERLRLFPVTHKVFCVGEGVHRSPECCQSGVARCDSSAKGMNCQTGEFHNTQKIYKKKEKKPKCTNFWRIWRSSQKRCHILWLEKEISQRGRVLLHFNKRWWDFRTPHWFDTELTNLLPNQFDGNSG